MGFGDGSGISWTICKQSALRSRQTTTPTPHYSMSTGRMLFLTPNQQCQSIAARAIRCKTWYMKQPFMSVDKRGGISFLV